MAFSSMTNRAAGYVVKAATDWNVIVGNFAAIWVGTTAGDWDYYTSATTKDRLAAPAAVTSILSETAAGVPSWLSAGLSKIIGYASYAPAQTRTSTSFGDITGATVTLDLPAGNTYTVIALAGVVGSVDTAGFSCQVCAMIDGTIDPNQLSLTSSTVNSPIAVGYLRTGIASGSRIVKLRFRVFNTGATATADRGWLIAIAITE